MHELPEPYHLPGAPSHSHERVRVGVAAQPLAAVEVRAGARGWEEHKIVDGVCCNHGPDVCGPRTIAIWSTTTVGPGAPGCVPLRSGYRVKRPAKRTRSGIVCAHHATGGIRALV